MRSSRCGAAAVLAALLVPAACVAADFPDLLRRVPEQANALLLMDVQRLHNCPLGQKEGWAKHHERDYVSGVASLPPTAAKVVVAAHLDPGALEHTWKIGLMESTKDVTLEQLARGEAGTRDTVAGEPVLLSPRNAYFLSFGPRTKGMMHPANRQELARWVRSAKKGGGPAVSEYLREAARGVTAAPIVMALDMADVVDPQGVRNRLKVARALEGKKVDAEALTRVLTGLRGVRFSARVGADIDGELRVDFSGPVTPLMPHAKPLLLEALEGAGLAVDDLGSWTAGADGNAVVMRGKLSERGLRQTLSLMLSPAATGNNPEANASSPGNTAADPQAVTSQRYYRSVTKLLHDLREERPRNYNNLGYIHNKYAQQIDELPVLNVDKELLDYGAAVAAALRGMGMLARNTSTQGAYLRGQATTGIVPYYGNYSGGGWGYSYNYSVPTWGVASNVTEVRNLIAQGEATEVATRRQTWKNIDDATAKVRRQMVEKYKMEF